MVSQRGAGPIPAGRYSSGDINMDKSEVIALMESSKSDNEWNENCDKVKDACNGYPDYWYREIVMSGLCDRVSQKFGGSGSKITISKW